MKIPYDRCVDLTCLSLVFDMRTVLGRVDRRQGPGCGSHFWGFRVAMFDLCLWRTTGSLPALSTIVVYLESEQLLDKAGDPASH